MIKPHKIANVFMLFLLSFYLIQSIIISYLYWNLWENTAFGNFLSSPWYLMIGQITGLLGPLAIFKILEHKSPVFASEKYYKVPRLPLGLVNIFFVVAITFLIQPIVMLVAALVSVFIPNPVPYMMMDIAVLPLPQALIVIAITPAICEELVFREYIQSKYRMQPLFITALINGLFFGILHMNIHQFTYAFIMGILFVYMVYITRSILSAILAHFVLNATQYTLGYMAIRHQGSITGGLPQDEQIWENIMALGIIAFLIMPLLGGVYYLFYQYNTKRKAAMGVGEVLPDLDNKPGNPFDLAFWAVVATFIFLLVLLR